jgi:methyl-accepting chemotaxis protein
MTKYKRKKKLINSSLQLRMIAVFMGIAATTSLFQVVLLNSALTGVAKDLPEAGDQLMRELPRIMLTNVGLTVAVLVPLMFAIGLMITHRIAGPAYRMQTYCKSVARGEATGPCRIRKDDELWDLCDALNEAMDALRARQQGRGTGTPSSEQADGEAAEVIDDAAEQRAA